ncbi:ABC transporter substrate-binding protein [Nonomuraea sp. NPDC050310]|uniref:ABC transporter substrate-binding protein n=1 Tax=Nonomuraea sp. NPDC050310 TaxID=3154935 RepID=UPI0033DDCEE2
MGLARRLAALTVAATLATACSAPQGPAPAAGGAGDAFVIGLGSEFENLSPVLGFAADGGSLMFDGLMRRAPDLSLQPNLASAPPASSPDGKTVTFTLREGVKFHDGRPLTARDVAYTYTTLLDPKTNSPISGDYSAIEQVSAKDDRTVEFTLKHPYAPLVQRTTLGIVPEGGIDPAKPVGTGPYSFVSWTPGDKVVLKANESYFGGAPAIKNVVLAFALDDNVRSTRLAAGEFDAAILPPKAAKRFENTAGTKVYRVDSADYRGIMFPMKEKVTGDLAVRKAFDLAVDRQAMVDTILAGSGKPAFGPISPDISWHNPAVTGNPRPDRDQAAKLLDEAGWKLGEDGVRAKDGLRAAFTLMYPAGDSLRKELALATASDAKKIGLEVKPEGLDWDAIEPRMAKDALIMGYGSPYDPDYLNYELFHSSYQGKGFFNPGYYANPEVDKLLETGRESADEAVRKQAYTDFQKIIHDQQVWTYLVFLKHVYVVRGDWQGITPSVDAHEHATGGLFRDLASWKPGK